MPLISERLDPVSWDDLREANVLKGSDSDLVVGQQQRHRLRQVLPFRVTLVTTDGELRRAVAARASAYLRHNAPAADKLRVAEDDDLRDDVAVLVARSKLDDGILGTIRINSNHNVPLKFESSATLEAPQSDRRCVEFMRLGVLNGSSGRLVTTALAKASYEICVATGVDYIFVASRPPVDIVYRAYRFDDYLNGRKVELPYAPGVMNSILCLPVAEAEERWRRESHRIHRFFIETEHPDIQIDYQEIARRFGSRAATAPGGTSISGSMRAETVSAA